MYYNDIVHKREPKYTEDTLQWCNQDILNRNEYKEEVYNPYQMMQLERKPVYQEEVYNPFQMMQLERKPVYQEEVYNPYQVIKLEYKPVYQEEEYYTREYGDIGFYKWLNEQNHKCIAILAEIVSAPKLNPVIEKLRPEVKHMKTITIDEYRKIKCIGSTKVEWLKQLKKKYGINILRFLHASL